jgi:flagellar protein FlbT
MALQVELKPGERIIIGDSVIANPQDRIRLIVHGSAPILREKEVLTPETANSPAKRIYLAVQLMYIANTIEQTREEYLDLVIGLIEASPSCTPYIARISSQLFAGNYYKALKEAKALVAYEEQILMRLTLKCA